jgi:toxin CptA
LLAGLVILGAASLGFFGYNTVTALSPLNWQFALLAATWLISTAAVRHFLHQLPQGDIDFDGENWYLPDQATKTEHVGTVSVRLDVQNGMLLRFESEFKCVSWLWLDAGFKPDDWHDLRRAVYSRPAIQNSPDLI